MADFDIAHDKVMKFEGGYSNNPNDHGNETMMGLTKRDDKSVRWDILDQYKAATYDRREFGELYKLCLGNIEFMQSVKDCYFTQYWKPIKGAEIEDQDVANNIYDLAVNGGVSRASKYAQRVLGINEDGIIGDITIHGINQYDPVQFIQKYKALRRTFYHKIVERDPSQEVFLNGWLNRVENV